MIIIHVPAAAPLNQGAANETAVPMNFQLLVAMAAVGLGLIIPVASPLLVLAFPKCLPPERRSEAKHYAYLSAFVSTIVLSSQAGISIAFHPINVVLIASAIIAGFVLAGFLFKLRPPLLAVPLALYSLLAWILVLLVLAFGLMIAEASRRTATLQDGTHCLMTFYGFAGSDSGEIIEVFTPYLVVDQRIGKRVFPHTGPGPADNLPYLDKGRFEQCRTAITDGINLEARGSPAAALRPFK